MPRPILLLFLALLCASCGGPAPSPETAALAPAFKLARGDGPVILISIDTTRRDHCSVYGYHRPTTPHLERLARDGVVFEQAIAAHTNTTPSHATMLTGLPPISHGAVANGIPIAPATLTLAELLVRDGYRTAAFLSAGTLARNHSGLGKGFNVYNQSPLVRRVGGETLAQAKPWLADVARREDRVFLFFHSYDPHYDYQLQPAFERFALADGVPVPDEPMDNGHIRHALQAGEREAMRVHLEEWVRRYDASIAYADSLVGEIVAQLRQLGLYEAALILVTSDHGETLDERDWVFDHGARVTEEQVRVPLVIKFPFGAFRGQRVDEQVAHVDYFRTIADVLGKKVPDSVEGRSLLALLEGDGGATPPAFSLARRAPERLDDVPATIPPAGDTGTRAALVASVRVPPLKLVDYSGLSASEGAEVLHVLGSDPGETKNALAARSGDGAELRRLLQEWWNRESRQEGTRSELPADVEEDLRALGYIE